MQSMKFFPMKDNVRNGNNPDAENRGQNCGAYVLTGEWHTHPCLPPPKLANVGLNPFCLSAAEAITLRSIPWLIMPWLLASPFHQQPCHWHKMSWWWSFCLPNLTQVYRFIQILLGLISNLIFFHITGALCREPLIREIAIQKVSNVNLSCLLRFVPKHLVD